MRQATMSNDYRIAIPEEIRRQVSLRPGEDVQIFARDGIITLIPASAQDKGPGNAREQSADCQSRASSLLADLAAAQGVAPAGPFEELSGGWPEDELEDGFEDAVRAWRDDELARNRP